MTTRGPNESPAGDGLIFACLLDGGGGGRRIDRSAIDLRHGEQGLLWVHLDPTIDAAETWLTHHAGLGPITVASLLDEGTRPRLNRSEDGVVVILRGVNCNPGADPEDMVAIRMLFTEQRIITLNYRTVMAIEELRRAVEDGRGPATAGDALVMVAERIADRMGDVIADLDEGVDDIEDSVHTEDVYKMRTDLADFRRMAVTLRRYIAPQRDVLARLHGERLPWLDDDDRRRLREVYERTARFVEDVEAARDRAAVSQEELNHRMGERMNRAMYTLSIVAAIFLPLSFLTSLLGINVGGLPGADNPRAFMIFSAILAAVGLGLAAWFKKIKWW